MYNILNRGFFFKSLIEDIILFYYLCNLNFLFIFYIGYIGITFEWKLFKIILL